MTSPQTFAAHNIDAIVAVVAVPVFLLAGLPLEGWFWATALWAVNRHTAPSPESIQPGMTVLLPPTEVLERVYVDAVQATVRAIPGIVEGLRERGMCPGFLATTQRSVRAANGVSFHVTAVKP